MTIWKWSDESRYPGALPPMLENFCGAFPPSLTDCPWVAEDAVSWVFVEIHQHHENVIKIA